jgi:cytochrome o ubiquinol oxidase subunit 2
MNGMVTELNLAADRTGSYLGIAAHFNGDGFSDMNFETRAIAAGEFLSWVATTQADGPILDETAYRALLRQSVIGTPYSYRNVASHLFDEIAAQHLPAGYGPPGAKLATSDDGAAVLTATKER